MKKSLLPQDRQSPLHIIGGASVEGSACLRYLLKKNYQNLTVHEVSPRAEFTKNFAVSHVALPKKDREKLALNLLRSPVKFCWADDYLRGIENANALFVSQNWFNYPFNFPALALAKEKGIPMITLAELYFSLSPAPIIGVTGTNGKTTTVNLLHHILSGSKKVFLAGNDLFHPQVLHKLGQLSARDYLLLELSNRQLMALEQSPHIGVITNIEEDHLDEHGGFEAYQTVKKKIFQFQKPGDFAILNHGHRLLSKWSDLPGQTIFYGSPESAFQILGDRIVYRERNSLYPLISLSEIPLKGRHNWENCLAALATAHCTGLDHQILIQGLKTFGGVKNRLEWIRTLGGVEFYNDLASTSPVATLAALRALPGKIFLLAGGDVKGAHYGPLVEELQRRDVELLLLDGSVADQLEGQLKGKSRRFSQLKEAVLTAWQEARPGDLVVLSPGGSHFYSKYIQGKRGFIRLVKRLKRA